MWHGRELYHYHFCNTFVHALFHILFPHLQSWPSWILPPFVEGICYPNCVFGISLRVNGTSRFHIIRPSTRQSARFTPSLCKFQSERPSTSRWRLKA
ncbi:hypothetical protein BDZ97DRAFT_781207 [Flammula alnicola]|nr:hypothetical protein BDZ97DRAFT_781207 [Flammula alnicola]